MFKINKLDLDERCPAPPADKGCNRADQEARLEQFGPRGLSDLELLGEVMGSGGKVSGPEAAANLLERFGSLAELAAVPPAVLATTRGLGPVRAGRLTASLELGMRALGPVGRSGILVRRPEDLHLLLRDSFRGLDRERFLALYLDTRHRVRAVETVSVGSLNASLVHPREVFKTAIGMSAAALIVAHNHPSGCPQPSGDDLELTARLAGCGELLGIALLDHLVVGDVEIVSIREYGWPEPARGNL